MHVLCSWYDCDLLLQVEHRLKVGRNSSVGGDACGSDRTALERL